MDFVVRSEYRLMNSVFFVIFVIFVGFVARAVMLRTGHELDFTLRGERPLMTTLCLLCGDS
jgi:hypothetical protein